MADRGKKTSSSREKTSGTATVARQSQFFISGEGIDREVITTDICRYLGNDALVKPGTHHDKATGRVQDGFYITAYRPPTSAQLADLRADSARWREERQRSTRSQGGYNESATRQEAMRGGNTDEPRLQSGGYPPTTYPSMASSMNAPMAGRAVEYPRVAYTTNTTTAMSPPAAAVSNRYTQGYPTSDNNYTYGPPQTQPGYNSMDNNRDRMDTAPVPSPWMQPGSVYPPTGPPQIGSNYAQGRPTYNYSPVGGNPPVPAGYGRAEPSGYSDPYGPRDSAVPPPEPQGDYYTNDDDMEYEESPAPTPAPAPAPARRERESRESHDSSKRRHGHRS